MLPEHKQPHACPRNLDHWAHTGNREVDSPRIEQSSGENISNVSFYKFIIPYLQLKFFLLFPKGQDQMHTYQLL